MVLLQLATTHPTKRFRIPQRESHFQSQQATPNEVPRLFVTGFFSSCRFGCPCATGRQMSGVWFPFMVIVPRTDMIKLLMLLGTTMKNPN